jgi:SAM-dependent methyltransferase
LISFLERIVPCPDDRPELGGPDHPMRKVTRQVAFDPGGWTPERAGKISQLFDTMAPQWNERTRSERQDALRDALARGGFIAERSGVCLEVGSGTGSSSEDLARRFATVLALDLSREMLRLAPAGPARRVNADGARLPIRDRGASGVVLVNALLFPTEVARVLAPDGSLVWVNSLGDKTPIHLPADDVARAMPGTWSGVASEAGWGTWCVLRRNT